MISSAKNIYSYAKYGKIVIQLKKKAARQ